MRKFFSLGQRGTTPHTATTPLGGKPSLSMALRQVARFKHKAARNELFSTIHRPLVTVEFWSPTDRKWSAIEMLVDTGADFSILPKYIATLLGIDLTAVPVLETHGIGGAQIVHLVEEVRVRIGQAERVVPVGFIPQAKAPALLGRHLFLETFVTTFETNQWVTFAE